MHEAPEEGSGTSRHRSGTKLEFGDRALRGWHFDDQGRGARRHGDVGLAGGEVVLGDPSRTAGQRHSGAPLEVNLCRLGARLEACLRVTEVGHVCAVSDEARRTSVRPSSAASLSGVDPEAGKVEAAEVGDEVREGRTSGSGGDEAFSAHAELCGRTPQADEVCPDRSDQAPRAPRRPLPVKALRLLDAFGGVGCVTAECKKFWNCRRSL